MRVFKHFPKEDKCPACNTSEDKECVLVAIYGTQEGHNAQAKCFHLDCLDLWYYEKEGVIAQKLKQ